MCEIEYMPI